jgi:hypothetical protein
MNAREALLKKRVRYLEAQVEALMHILEHVESVANSFAFDSVREPVKAEPPRADESTGL